MNGASEPGRTAEPVIVAILVVVAIGTEKTLVRLLELKFEVLIQIAPCFLLGLYWRYLSSETVALGMVAGLVMALGLTWTGQARLLGFHAGVLGLGINLSICAIGTLYNQHVRRNGGRICTCS